MRVLEYSRDVQAILDAVPSHVWQLLNGWGAVIPVLVGLGVLLTVIRRARTVI